MSSSGVVSLRLRCLSNAKGSVQLRSAGRVKTGKGKARRISLGRKSFAGKKGQRLNVRVKVAKGARECRQAQEAATGSGDRLGPPRRLEGREAEQEDNTHAESVGEEVRS